MDRIEATEEQHQVCREHGAAAAAPDAFEKLGIALGTLTEVPLNGLRHRPEAGTSGWYTWGGESTSEAPDFFAPLHHRHVADYCPAALPFLALPPGWRFLVAPGHVDVWFDPKLLGAEDAQ